MKKWFDKQGVAGATSNIALVYIFAFMITFQEFSVNVHSTGWK
jgi:hypothetical protein